MTYGDESAARPVCPTCGAAFRGGEACGRCGTDLRRLGSVWLEAHALREEARRALLADRPEVALTHLTRARRLHDTTAGRRLEVLALIAADHLCEGVHRAAELLSP